MQIENLTASPRSGLSAFVAAVTGAHYAFETLPDVLMYYPGLKLNPFHELFYGAASGAHTVTIPLNDIGAVDEICWGGRVAVHLHWLHALLNAAKSEEDADRIVGMFGETLERWKSRGIRIIWTVHNVLPHQPRFPTAELSLHKLLAGHADLVHVMSRHTAALAKPWYEWPEARTAHVPHPSYEGWYGNAVKRSQARQMLGIADDEQVFLFFGSLQAYKGLLELVSAFEELRRGSTGKRMRLLIAGGVADVAYVKSLKQRVSVSDGISLLARSIPEGHIQIYFNAADVAVAPYSRTLNSGVALLASTFRCPMVAPAMGAMTEVFGADHPLLYDATADDGLVCAMRRSLEYVSKAGYFDEIMERHAPARVSAAFFAEVKKMFDGKPSVRKKRVQGRKK